MSITVKTDMKGLDNLVRRMKTLAKQNAKVGFFEGSNYDDGMPVAQVAAYNEYGTRFNPARPFMSDTITDKDTIKKIVEGLKAAAKASISGNGNIRSIMKTIGKIVAEDMKVVIANYPGSNAESTVAAKGFNRPLYETGKMLESVKVVIG